MAKKNNLFAEEIDLTSFSWVTAGFNPEVGKPGCGGCHPGGGGLEYDRDGFRYDERLREKPELAASLDGDYYMSKWDKTGVVEADCLICHQPGYFFKQRVKNLGLLNFKWAIIAGSGIGQVHGAVKNGEEPKVVYNKRFFNDDGKIVLNLTAHPNSENCLFCHGPADMIKRGFSWDDHQNHDIHNTSNMSCVSCHPGNKEHQLAKGSANLSTVRDDLDNTMLTCAECHASGYMGAPTPQHSGIRPNHLDKLACEVCHIPELGRSSAYGLDVSTGKVRLYPREGAKKVGSPLKWFPEMYLGADAKLHPVNTFLPNLYTNRSQDGVYHPLFGKEIKKAYQSVSAEFRLQKTSQPLINTTDEISTMLKALQLTLADNPRFAHVNPCYHTGGYVYSLDAKGTVSKQIDMSWASEANLFNINHNVAPTQFTLGANGCADCHEERSDIFASWVAGKKGDKPDGGEDETMLSSIINDNVKTFYLNQLHKYNSLKTYLIPMLFAGIFTLVLFRESRAPSVPLFYNDPDLPVRLLPFFAWLLLIRNITFLLLAFTGSGFFFNRIGIIGLFFASQESAVIMHWATGGVFLCSILICVMIRKSILRKKSTDICHLNVFGGKAFIGLLGISGAAMVFRDYLAGDIVYISSIIHIFAAFMLMAVFAAKSYHTIMRRINRLETEEIHGKE